MFFFFIVLRDSALTSLLDLDDIHRVVFRAFAQEHSVPLAASARSAVRHDP